MVSVGNKIDLSLYQPKYHKRVVVPFKGQVASNPLVQSDEGKRIPDPIYNFFLDLPKYEIHSHFNGSTPLNISKLFLNKEGQCIGQSQVDIENKYTDIRKHSTSLADWLKKTYELKAKNISTMDIISASYAIAMEEAKHNCRYLEVRVDPFSSSFVGAPEDVVRAVEVGLKNAQEDIRANGKDLKTSIILLAERHAAPEKALTTAKLATRLKGQRVLYNQMNTEMKAAIEAGKPFDYSRILADSFVDTIKLRGILRTLDRLSKEINDDKQFDREAVTRKLDNVHELLINPVVYKKDKNISMNKVDSLYKGLTKPKTKSISAIDLSPAVYSKVLQMAKNGEKNIRILIDPTDSLFMGKPEDILRAVQVGLRNAEKDLEPNSKIHTSIVININPENTTPEKAQEIAKLAIKMKSQRVIFDNMYIEMKEAVQSGQIFEKSSLMDNLVDDTENVKAIKGKALDLIENAKNPQTLKDELNAALFEGLKKIHTSNAQIKVKNAIVNLMHQIKDEKLTEQSRQELAAKLEQYYAPATDYIEDKAVLATRIFDALGHLSSLKLDDEKNGTKNYDRYLRMGTGVIPNVIGVNLPIGQNFSLRDKHTDVIKAIFNYNGRKTEASEKVSLFMTQAPSMVDLKNSIENGECINGKLLNVADVEDHNSKESLGSPLDVESDIIHSTPKISKDILSIKEIVQNSSNPDEYLKNVVAKSIRELLDKLHTQRKLQDEQFLTSRRLFANLQHAYDMEMKDKQNGGHDARRLSRMGVDIVPNVSGFDIAGNENDYPLYLQTKALDYIKAYNDAIENPEHRLKVTVHAGEVKISKEKDKEGVPGWQNILDAIKHGASRIGHGIDLRNAPQWLKDEVKLRNITIETCPKSNYQVKAIEGYREHPVLDFLDQGLPATVNTDNPVTSGTNLTNEFVKVFKRFNFNISPEDKANGVSERMTLGHVKALIHNAIWGAFSLTPQEKAEEEKYAMQTIDQVVHKYEDKVVLKDNEPIMLKAQKQVVAFTGSIWKKANDLINKKKVA